MGKFGILASRLNGNFFMSPMLGFQCWDDLFLEGCCGCCGDNEKRGVFKLLPRPLRCWVLRTVSVSLVVVAFVCCRLLAETKGSSFLLQKLLSLVDGCC